jgi:hypothetical protein
MRCVKKNAQRGRPQMATWRMRIACWIPKATNIHSQYIMLIAFPLQQWLHERVRMLIYTNNAYLVIRIFSTVRRSFSQ